MFTSVGTIRCSRDGDLYRAALEVDPSIVAYYRWFVPRTIRLNHQKYAPHVSVIRETSIPDEEMFWWFNGTHLRFQYDHYIRNDKTYWWLNVDSYMLCEVRKMVGLMPTAWYTQPPDFSANFHITIGNTK